jgi:hypothetical protein
VRQRDGGQLGVAAGEVTEVDDRAADQVRVDLGTRGDDRAGCLGTRNQWQLDRVRAALPML